MKLLLLLVAISLPVFSQPTTTLARLAEAVQACRGTSGIRVHITVNGGSTQCAVLDPSIVLDTSTNPPTLRAVGASTIFVEEVLQGTIDGVNVSFTMSFIPSQVEVFSNGLRLWVGEDYTRSGSTFTFVPLAVPQPGHSLKVKAWR